MFKLEDLQSKSRKELQKLSKENNLKANGKNAEMIERLLALTLSTSEEQVEEKVAKQDSSKEEQETEKVDNVVENDVKLVDQEAPVKQLESQTLDLQNTPRKESKEASNVEAAEEKQYTPRTSKRIAEQETKSLDRATYAIKKHKGDTPKSASQALSKSKIPATRRYGFVRKFPISKPTVPQVPLQSIPLPRDNPQKVKST